MHDGSAEPRRRRGEGDAMLEACFRDPVGFADEVATSQLEVAAALVGAPRLPVHLPAFDLTLLSIAAERRAISLVIGKSEPIAKLRITRVAGSAEITPAVQVSVVPAVAELGRFDAPLKTMARRLERAITVEKWQRAATAAGRLAKLPVDVPLAFYRQLVPGVSGQALIRTGFLCNQDCGICWQDRSWGGFDAAQIQTWIEDLRAAGAASLIISGGEPTLDRQLPEYIRTARAVGFEQITLETNAIQFSKGDLATRLHDAGLSDCFVSLHSPDATTSDQITRAPGTFRGTIAGIQALLAAGVPVKLNCVMTRAGLALLPELPDFIDTTFARHPLLTGLMISQPSDPFDRSLLREIVPDPDAVRAVLPRVIDRAAALGLSITGLDGPCGPPLCAFGADRRVASLRPVREQLDARLYLPECERCAVRAGCFGVRSADVELFGGRCAAPLRDLPEPR